MTRSWQITKHSPILANQIAELRHNRMTEWLLLCDKFTAAAVRVHEPKGMSHDKYVTEGYVTGSTLNVCLDYCVIECVGVCSTLECK